MCGEVLYLRFMIFLVFSLFYLLYSFFMQSSFCITFTVLEVFHRIFICGFDSIHNDEMMSLFRGLKWRSLGGGVYCKECNRSPHPFWFLRLIVLKRIKNLLMWYFSETTDERASFDGYTTLIQKFLIILRHFEGWCVVCRFRLKSKQISFAFCKTACGFEWIYLE